MAATSPRRPLRVVALGFRGFPGVQGGIERHAEELYPILAELGCEIEAVVRAPYVESKTPYDWRGIRMVPLWSPVRTGLEAAVHSLLATLYAIRRRPDIVHVHAIGPSLFVPLARLAGLRVVVTTQGSDYVREKWGTTARTILRLGERFGMRLATRRISVTQSIADDMTSKYGRRSVVIPNGVRLSTPVTGTRTLESFGLASGRYVACVARVVPEKRQLDLIRAFAAAGLPGWKLAIVGAADPGSDYAREVTALAAATPGVVWTGFQTGAALTELYQNAGLYVLPSMHEGLPLALLEAVSFAVPVLASDIAANREVGLDASHYFPVGDISALAERIRDRALHPPSEAVRAELARTIARRFEWRRIAERTLAVYRSALIEAPGSLDDDRAEQLAHVD